MTLSELQALFWEAARGRVSAQVLDQYFTGHHERSGASRMRIYNGAYFARLEAALADTFPVTLASLGAARFQELARRYVIKFPGQRPSLERLGEHFPSMLRDCLPEAQATIAQVADLEYARVSALLAPEDAAATGPLALQHAELQSVRFVFVRSWSHREVTREAFRAWSQECPENWEGAASGVLSVAVWRHGFKVRHRTLLADEAAALLDNTGGQVHLLHLCERLVEHEDAVPRAFGLVRRWLAEGWVARIDWTPSGKARETDDEQ